MANTTAQKQAELWIVNTYLPERFNGHKFKEQKLKLKWGGHFAFDAVNEDQSLVGLVSTSPSKTASGGAATAKIQKLKCDSLYLLNINSDPRKFMVFSEISMLDHFRNDVKTGRFPDNIELIHINLPREIYINVLAARKQAQLEVSPVKEI
jgi:hypothetical protein